MNSNQDTSDIKEPLYKYVKDYYWSIFRSNTTILSSTCRQLALGVGSISWFAKSNACYAHVIWQTNSILILLVLFFIFDAGQYIKQSSSFRSLAIEYDTKIDTGEITKISELVEKPGVNAMTFIFFIAKLATLGFASMFFIYVILKT